MVYIVLIHAAELIMRVADAGTAWILSITHDIHICYK